MILSVERRQIPPDIVVLEMTGKIVLGNSSRDVELKLAEILADPPTRKSFSILAESPFSTAPVSEFWW